ICIFSFSFVFVVSVVSHCALHSFPTRRSSDLGGDDPVGERGTRRDPELRTGPRSRRPHFELGRGNRIGPVESGCAVPAREDPHTVRRSTPVTVTDDRVSWSRVTCHDDVPQDRLIHAVLELSIGSRVTNLETRLGEDRHDLFAGGHQGVPGNTQGTAG